MCIWCKFDLMSWVEDAVFFQFSHVRRTLHQLCDLVPLLKMLLCEYCSFCESFFRQFLCWTDVAHGCSLSVWPRLFRGQLPIYSIPLDTFTCWAHSPFMKISFINSATLRVIAECLALNDIYLAFFVFKEHSCYLCLDGHIIQHLFGFVIGQI